MAGMDVWLVERSMNLIVVFFFQAEDGIRDLTVTGVQTCALPIFNSVPSANEVNVTGAVSITNSVLTNSRYHGVDIQQFGGTISTLNISNNTFTKIGRASCRERV